MTHNYRFRLTAALLAAAALAAAGCSNFITTEPLANASDTAIEPGLNGIWRNAANDEEELLRIRPDGKGAYDIGFIDNSAVYRLKGRLIRSGEATLLDLVSVENEPLHVPAHLYVRIWLDGDQLRWAFLDSEWLRGEARGKLVARAQGDQTLTTANPAELRKTLLPLLTDARAIGEKHHWRRLQ